MAFFMDKKRAPLWIKIFAGVLAFSFILGTVIWTVDIFLYGSAPQEPAQNNLTITEEEAQFDTDARMYSNIVAQNTTDTTSWIGLGNTYYDWAVFLMQNKGDTKKIVEKLTEAEKAYTKAIELDPTNNNTKVELAAVKFYLGKLQDAKDLLDEVLSKEPDHAAALFNAALVARDLGDFNSAIAYLERFIEKNPMDQNISSAKQLLSELKKEAGAQSNQGNQTTQTTSTK